MFKFEQQSNQIGHCQAILLKKSNVKYHQLSELMWSAVAEQPRLLQSKQTKNVLTCPNFFVRLGRTVLEH